MKAFKGYEDAVKAAQYNGSAQIPAGAYVCKILNVKFEEGQNGGSDRIAIQFDVVEGEHKDFSRISMITTLMRIRSGRVQQEFTFLQMMVQNRTDGLRTLLLVGLIRLKSQMLVMLGIGMNPSGKIS